MPQGSDATSRRSRTTLGVVLVILAIDALVAAAAWRALHVSRRGHYDQASRMTQSLAQVLGENLEGTLHLVDFALSEAKTALEHELARGGRDPEAVESLLLRLYTQLPFVDAIRTANAEGRLVHGAGPPGTPTYDVSDRDYFLRSRALPGVDMVVSAPLVSRITGKRSLVFARRLDGPDGRFAGVVYAVVELEQFTRALARIRVGTRGTVALRTGDHALVARYPEPAGDAMGQRKLSPRLDAALAAGLEEGTFVTASPVDGLEKVTSFRVVGERTFLVLVAMASDEFLAPWRGEARVTWGAWLLFALLTALGGWLLLGALRREEEARSAAERERLIGELQQALSEVKTLGGLLPICSHCKKVRDDRGYWNRIETFIRERSNAEFTHGICPDCEKRFYSGEGSG